MLTMPFATRHIIGTSCWYQKRHFIECHRFDDARRWCYLRYKVDGVWKYTECRHARWVDLCRNWPCPCWLYKDLSVSDEGDNDLAQAPTGDVVDDVDNVLGLSVQGVVKIGPFSDDNDMEYPPINPYVREFALRVKSGEVGTFTVLHKEVFRDTRDVQREWHIAVRTVDKLVYLPTDLSFAEGNEKFSRGSFTISNRLIQRVPMGSVGTNRSLQTLEKISLQSRTVGEVRPSRREFFIDEPESVIDEESV
jgi:hypothetical protein